MQLRKAERRKAKLRIGMSGPAGSGKTYSALLLASGMASWDKIALIDTESGSGELYANSKGIGQYQYLRLNPNYTPERYIEAIKTCEDAGIEVIIIDSATHEWDGTGGCLETVDQITQASRSKNSYIAWGKVTPRHKKFIDAIIQSPCHIITTTRRKQDYDMGKDERGKTVVTKVGLKEIQREGFEYELTVAFDIDITHHAVSSKDRTGLFDGVPEFKIGKETGEALMKWSNSGTDAIEEEVVYEPEADNLKDPVTALMLERLKKKSGDSLENLNEVSETPIKEWSHITQTQAKKLLKKLM
jgi:hypothetical protein